MFDSSPKHSRGLPLVLRALRAAVALFLVTVVASIVLVPKPAFADPGVSQTAAELWADAKQARKDGNWSLCRGRALAAWRIEPEANLALLLSECELRLNHPVQAAGAVVYFQGHHELPAGHVAVQHADELLATASTQVARVALSATPAPNNLRFSVDNQPVFITAPASIDHPGELRLASGFFVAPGRHTFTADGDGFQQASITIELAAGATRALTLELVPVATEPIPHPTPHPSEPLPGWPAYVGGGVAVALIVAGIVLHVAVAPSQEDDANALRDDLRRAGGGCPADVRCAERASLAADARATHDVGTGLLIGGGGLGLAALLYGIIAATSGGDETAAILPAPGPALLGGGLQIKF